MRYLICLVLLLGVMTSYGVRGPKKHIKRLTAPRHWMLDKMSGIFASCRKEARIISQIEELEQLVQLLKECNEPDIQPSIILFAKLTEQLKESVNKQKEYECISPIE